MLWFKLSYLIGAAAWAMMTLIATAQNQATNQATNQAKPPPAATSEKMTEKKSASKKKKDEPAPTALDRLIPIGKSSEKVTLPSFDENGHLTSLINIDRVKRLDADRFSLEGLTLLEYPPPEAPAVPGAEVKKKKNLRANTRMDLLTGELHQSTQTISSDRRTRIIKPEFEIVGDSLNYRTSDGVGLMRGNVQLLLREATATKKSVISENMTPVPTDPKSPAGK
jgi:hypothetical protein